MSDDVRTIDLSMSNCYLVRADGGDVLIDTGWGSKRRDLLAALENNGCRPGTLKLIVLTHGDFDHSANAAYLRESYGAPIGMHRGDAGIVARGDMSAGRSSRALVTRLAFGAVRLYGLVTRYGRFEPDVYLEEGDDLASYGLDARVLHLPGHSSGSIGILTASGDLFCGDLLSNPGTPEPGIVDDEQALRASIAQLRDFDIRMVYPGHGSPFPWSAFAERNL